MSKKKDLEIAHYKAGIKAIEALCNHDLASTNPAACIDAIKQFIGNLDYNNPVK